MRQKPVEHDMAQLNIKSRKKGVPVVIKLIFSILLMAAGAFILMFVLREKGYYISGNDAWGHFFKSDLMYRSILSGDYYPLHTNLWYNGLQPYRYWAPLPYYILAFFEWLAKGDIITTYYYFVGFSFFAGGCGWLLWGLSTRRMALCTFLGFMWFFLPDNIRVFFCEGNVPRIITAIIIPYLAYCIWLFVEKEKKITAVFITLLMSMMALSHLMISAMMGICTFIFLVFYVIANKKYLRAFQVIVSMLLGYAVIGIWLIPALIGGLVGMNQEASASVMESLTYALKSTLNPFTRITGVTDTYYYGISIISIAVIGIILANRKIKAGYYTNLIILLCTTPAMVPILSKLPLSQLLWMMRFTTIAYSFFMWSVIEWKNIKRYVTILLMALILIDCIPSFMLSRYYTQTKGSFRDELLIAKDITKQRVALMDLSMLGSYPSWELCTGENAIQYTYGWAWQGATTAPNIVMLNTAIENGKYEYLFDRCIELGNDTVIVLKELVAKAHMTEEDLIEAALASNYYLYKETGQAYIFHMDTPESFGVVTKYKGFGIGKYVDEVAFPYPTFIGSSHHIDDYTVEELAQYETIYLSGFEYHDRIKAESIITELADRGVRVVIDMDHIPVVRETKRMYFLGVVAQSISFTDSFPTVTYKGEKMYFLNFPEDHYVWNTKYIEGAAKVLGTVNYYDQELAFIGTNENENIIFLGLNMFYYSLLTSDQNAFKILNDCFNAELYELPERTFVPIDIKYEKDRIIIDTPVENVNTTIAYQDNFVSDSKIINNYNLLYVTERHTEIKLVYPYETQGMIVSAAGIGGTVVWMAVICVFDKKRRIESGEHEDAEE